ncbi:MAG: DNA mismatch repair protein MutS [Pirellulaceae bacterium]|jgi:DNA mismatch repair protein MutS
MSTGSQSPMMRQYMEAKAACGEALLLFRMGDFYELFYEDAKTVAKALGLTLTARDKGDNPIPMAGFPHHQLDGYLAKLIRQGFRVAVCEQVEDPKEAKGIVRREVQRIVTPGTLTDDTLLDPKKPNYLASVSAKPLSAAPEKDLVGLAWLELSTGRFEAGVFPRGALVDELARLAPSEILVRDDDGWWQRPDVSSYAITRRPVWQFGAKESERLLCEQFSLHDLSGMGWDAADGPAISAAGAALAYLQETQRGSLLHLRSLVPARQCRYLEIDTATRRSLELTETYRTGDRSGSLLAVMDETVTAMGARRLADWLSSPSTDLAEIESRLDAVAWFHADHQRRGTVREALSGTYDAERLLARVATGRSSPRDLKQLERTLAMLPSLIAQIKATAPRRLIGLRDLIDPHPQLQSLLEKALEEECPLQVRDGGFIRTGFDERLDELRGLATGGKEWIAQYQAQQVEQTGIASLKVGFTSVFGYYLEVTHAHRDKIPPHFVRKQTLKNAERYITQELKEYEDRVLSADESAKRLEQALFQELRDTVQRELATLLQMARALAELDTLAGLAHLAANHGYQRPMVHDDPTLVIEGGRHPVLDRMLDRGTFIPNETSLGGDDGAIHLITGPNMAGKSTYIRQVALITLMAQMGSFVPAAKASIGIADRIFARVGASDELSKGHSTFMVEMVETARILHTATPKSLVILDEIGRGTSTYDGLSLAWAIVEFLHERGAPRTLFATHYHELIELEESVPSVRNFNVAAREWEGSVVFLHKIVPGGADRSYGIHVARLAGIPREVHQRAEALLEQFEAEGSKQTLPKVQSARALPSKAPLQMTLFALEDHPLLENLKALDLAQLSPIEAWKLLEQWQAELKPAGR